MKTFFFQTEQIINKPLPETFNFFSNAQNLQRVTPPHLEFNILSPLPIVMQPGTRIDYRLKIYRIPLHWRTEITIWEPPFRFVDTQIIGPYKKWIHEHRFESQDEGTRMTDRVEYALPGGWFAGWLNKIFVRRDIRKIFSFREQKFREIFTVFEK